MLVLGKVGRTQKSWRWPATFKRFPTLCRSTIPIGSILSLLFRFHGLRLAFGVWWNDSLGQISETRFASFKDHQEWIPLYQRNNLRSTWTGMSSNRWSCSANCNSIQVIGEGFTKFWQGILAVVALVRLLIYIGYSSGMLSSKSQHAQGERNCLEST